jgi:cobalt-zinc-cadmium efflux system outer membrane protein
MSAPRRALRTPASVVLALALHASSGGARAEAPLPASAQADALPGRAAVPPPVEVPRLLTLDEALRLLRTRGLDLLIAGASVMSAEADLVNAGAVANPSASVSVGSAFNYNSDAPGCSGCSRLAVNWGLTDSAALMDFVTGKRGLRVKAARSALAAARMGRADAARNLASQVKQQYAQVVLAKATLDFNRTVQETMTKTLELNKLRYPRMIDEGGLARVEIQKLEADQSVATSTMTLRQAQVGLAFLLGVRTNTPDFEVEKTLLTFRVPGTLESQTERSLFELALTNRPDLKGQGYQRLRAEDALALAKRTQIPDVTLSVQYSQIGTGQSVASPMAVLFGAQMNLPVLYQQQGEIRRARADADTQALLYEKNIAQVASDLATAWAAFNANRELVQRMETTLLGRAKIARDILEKQYRAGNATLMDYLDAQRTYIATNLEYLTDLTQYWTALFQLEQAVGVEELK